MDTTYDQYVTMTLLFFGSLAEQIGQREKVLSLPTTLVTLKDLRAWLQTQGLDLLVQPHIAIAVNGVKLEDDLALLELTPYGEVAFLPPVTGG